MIKSMFSGVSGLRSHQSKMDVIGNNIANVNTFGFKAARATFKESIYQTKSSSSDASTTFGGRNAAQVGYGSQIGAIDLLFTAGSYAPTDSPTDVMIDGQGLFMVGRLDASGTAGGQIDNPKGGTNSKIASLELTRVGDFKFDGAGYLVDSNGMIVYGVVNERAQDKFDPGDAEVAKLRPIRIQKADGSYDATGQDPRLNVTSISIGADGTISGIDDKNNPVTIAKIAIANVPNSNALEKSQGPYYKIKKNAGVVEAFLAGKGGTGQLMSNGLEMANVDLAREFSEMITTQRGFQANTRIITVSDQMLEDLMSIKR
ncbi:MAG: flagellar hook-basal body complex protein [Peptostreptococcaceae bacterium]|nr:flagellar hook-basal body complex protein [Peptostreptococcaceae bacterium]